MKRIKNFFITLRYNPLALLGFIIVFGIVLTALFAPFLAPYDPLEFGKRVRYQSPSLKHPFGTDVNGRDVFSRVIYGSRISLTVVAIVITLALLIGGITGLIAGYCGGLIDELLMRVTDIVLSFPPLVLGMAISSALGSGIAATIWALSFTWWPVYSRLVREEILSIKEEGYVKSAWATGASRRRVIFKHILPNCLTPITVQLSLDAGSIMIVAAGLSFIGVGAQPPTPAWGTMVSEGRSQLLTYWWWPTFPGLMITILVVGFNLIGDYLRDLLDPHLKIKSR